MKYIGKKRLSIIVIAFIAVVLAAGYAVGDYFVDYALSAETTKTRSRLPPLA